MNNDRRFYKMIDGVEVWVTVSKPSPEENQNPTVRTHPFNSAYRFNSSPGIYIGDFVKQEDGRVAWFETQEEAAAAGFSMAEKKINESR